MGWVSAALLSAGSLLPLRGGAASLYIVLGSDTAVWNVPGGINTSKYRNHFAPDLYTQPQNNAYQVMDASFRQQFTDSFGHPVKLTWWMLVGSAYGQADNTDVPLANLMPLYLMRKYHGAALQQLGDELTLHYHTFFWSDYNADGVFYWNEARTFHECRADFDQALAQSLLEEEVFPVSFRSGWHYMDNEWQQYLNQLLPYSMDDDYPNVTAWYTNEPIFNVLDWSHAPGNFVPFQPSPTNYQTAGGGPGWNVRSVKFQNVSQALMDQIFAAAAGGTDQVASLWGHLPEVDFLTNIARMDAMAHVAASNHPGVPFLYCTAVEAMQRWRGLADRTAPQLDIAEQAQGEAVTLSVHTSEPIFQPKPFVAVKDIFAQYRIVACQAAGTNSWTALLPVPRSQIAKYAVAVTDPAGNVATQLVRLLPDDLYIDNLDAPYEELAGQWSSTTNAAWGTDARIALLDSNQTAQVKWSLPLTAPGVYNTFVQVPAVSNAAGNIRFSFYAGDSNVLTVVFTNPLPAKEWVFVGAPRLDAAVSNWLEMVTSAGSRTNAVAVADVLKLSPLTLPLPGFISNVQTEPFDTTANLTWTTAAPATTSVDYGPDTAYGSFSIPNSLPGLNQVATLTNLRPGTAYFFRIHAVAGELDHTMAGSFTTASFATNATTVLLFDVTNSWKYTTNDLDGINWQAPGYDDSAWPGGLGLFWVDTRPTGPNPAVQPRNTQMPFNPATQYPFITYYFRKHFTFTNGTLGASLTFSNYVDDGALFYLNGAEVHRNNLPPPPTPIWNTNLATAYNCGGDATCPVLFSLAGSALTNVVSGENVVAVEVHNYSAVSPDITFGTALLLSRPQTPSPMLHYLVSGGSITLYWNGTGFRLQQAADLGTGGDAWTDVAEAVSGSPCTVVPAGTAFYRLRK